MEKAIFFVDARNIIGGRDQHRKEDPSYDFGYREIVQYLQARYQVLRGYYYDGAQHHSQRTAAKQRFFDS